MEEMISVIVPVYKVEKYLDRCISSIANQTYKNLEIILIDDGSPDRCPQMCDEWEKKDSRIKVIHKENGGASAARNAGLKAATGQYIAFVDSDDWIEPDMYEKLYKLIVSSEAQMALCQLTLNENKKVLSNKDIEGEKLSTKDLLDQFFRLKGGENPHSVLNRLIKRKLLQDFHFLENRMNEDVLANYLISQKCDCAVVTTKGLYHYITNLEGVTSSTFTEKKLDLLAVWDEVIKLVNQLTPEYAEAAKLNKERAYFTLLAKMHIDGYDKSDPRLREIKKMLKRAVRKYFFDLIQIKMSLSRKVLLILCLIF